MSSEDAANRTPQTEEKLENDVKELTEEEEEENERNTFLDHVIEGIITSRQIPMLMEEDIEYATSALSFICDYASHLLLKEPSVLELECPIKVCGDIHGQLNDLIRVLQTGGFDENSKYLFLGDYVDRGPNSLEVICLLFALKSRFPKNIYLLRGNHESPEMTESFGFADEIYTKIIDEDKAADVLEHFYSAFDCLPIAAVISGKIFCVHGGLSPNMALISEINSIVRPIAIPETGILADLLWSDPNNNVEQWGPNDRGATFTWGYKVAAEFIQTNQLNTIIRAHQMAQNGYSFPFSPKTNVITVFTASHYAGQYNNFAAFIEIGEIPTEIKYQVLSQVQMNAIDAPNTPRMNRNNPPNQIVIEDIEDDEDDELLETKSKQKDVLHQSQNEDEHNAEEEEEEDQSPENQDDGKNVFYFKLGKNSPSAANDENIMTNGNINSPPNKIPPTPVDDQVNTPPS